MYVTYSSSSSAIIEYPASDSQMSASQNSQYPSSLELFSQSGSACSVPLPIAHLTKTQCKPTSDLSNHPRTKVINEIAQRISSILARVLVERQKVLHEISISWPIIRYS